MKKDNSFDEIWKIMEQVGSKKKIELNESIKKDKGRKEIKEEPKLVIKGIIFWLLNIFIRGLFYGSIFYLVFMLLTNEIFSNINFFDSYILGLMYWIFFGSMLKNNSKK